MYIFTHLCLGFCHATLHPLMLYYVVTPCVVLLYNTLCHFTSYPLVSCYIVPPFVVIRCSSLCHATL